jgi:hypothetical protein
MSKKWNVVLRSDYPPETCIARLAEQIDIDQRMLFSRSGYKGYKPIVGRIAGQDFRLHMRRYWHNSFGPVLFGRVTAAGSGSLIEGYWEMSRWTRTSTRVWLIFAAVVGTPIFFDSLNCAFRPECRVHGDFWTGLWVPTVMVASGLLLPRLGAALSSGERKKIESMLEDSLVARPAVGPELESNWRSELDDYGLWGG